LLQQHQVKDLVPDFWGDYAEKGTLTLLVTVREEPRGVGWHVHWLRSEDIHGGIKSNRQF
jgi:hypothetical protein